MRVNVYSWMHSHLQSRFFKHWNRCAVCEHEFNTMGWGEVDICACWVFCKKFNAHYLLFEAFFDIMRIFGCVPPESESTFPFQYNIIFENINLSSHVAPLLREIDMGAHWLFCTKFNAQQLLFEAFLDIMHIFGSVWLESESTFSLLYNIWNISIFRPPWLYSWGR